MTGKYSYSDENGVHILSWDNAKYVNHRCDCNTIATGYGFAIAIRDIWNGQEISEEYGLFNLDRVIPLACGCTQCRKEPAPGRPGEISCPLGRTDHFGTDKGTRRFPTAHETHGCGSEEKAQGVPVR